MYFWVAFKTILFLVLALSSCEGRLRKRHGYYYKTTVQPSTSFEPSYAHSAPAHVSLPPPSPAATDPSSNKYDSSYYDYKISSSSLHPAKFSSSIGGKSGYSIGSGLRSIAQGSANQAHSAVANQHAAAKQAAFIAKNTLAQTASQAAATAQAALAGKHVILQELEQQTTEAQRSLTRELEQLKSAQEATKLSQHAAQAAYNHVSVLTAAVNNAKALAESAEQASKEVSNQLASQSSMVGQAKNRLEQLDEQLQQARVDYAATKEATLKASSLASEAQVNASKAAAHATIGLHESANQQSSYGSSGGGSSTDGGGNSIGKGEGEGSYDEHSQARAIGHSSYEIPVDSRHS